MTIDHNISKEEWRIKRAIDAIANFAKGVKEVERAQQKNIDQISKYLKLHKIKAIKSEADNK